MMEASAVHAPALSRLSLSAPLLRLRSDEQLVALFRAGSEEAFSVIHDRYRQRLFAYARQMLSSASRQDAEDVLQDVFVRAYGALRSDARDINLRAWLYRVAHNRCIDHLRRPTPPAAEIFEMSRTPLHDPMDTAQRREDLRRLVEDVGRLPEQQRSALLMREIDGMAYADIAAALDVTVPAVKSLLVRARVGLVEAIEARDTDCTVIREDLAGAYDRGVKASGRARKHMRECTGCREYRESLRGMRRSFAALSPLGAAGPIALAAKALGIGGAGGGGAAAAGTAAGTATVTATACKVAAVVCATAITAGGAVEVKRLAADDAPAKRPQPTQSAPQAPATRPATVSAAAAALAPVVAGAIDKAGAKDKVVESTAVAEAPAADSVTTGGLSDAAAVVEPTSVTLPADPGGAKAPSDDEGVTSPTTTAPAATEPAPTGTGAGSGAAAPVTDDSQAAPAGEPSGSGDGPPPEH